MNNIEDYSEVSRLIISAMENPNEPNSELAEWIEANPDAVDMISHLASSSYMGSSCEEMKGMNVNTSKLLDRIDTKIARAKFVRRLTIAVSSVAAAILFVSLLIYTDFNDESSVVAESIDSSDFKVPTLITPEDNIELTGDKYTVKGENTTKLSVTDTKSIRQNRDVENVDAADENNTPTTNTLIVPCGYNYNIVLPDGTEVTLNSNSRFEFPSHFTGGERRVKLIGEGYFKVKNGENPFIVEVENSEVKVYGTQFNVKSLGKGTVETILVSGSTSVRVNGGKELLMVPGDMATLAESIVTIERVDPEMYLGWINGSFRYVDVSLPVVLTDLERWYGVEFEYSEAIDSLSLNFMIDRDEELLETIKFIEKLGVVKFINEGGGKYSVESY